MSTLRTLNQITTNLINNSSEIKNVPVSRKDFKQGIERILEIFIKLEDQEGLTQKLVINKLEEYLHEPKTIPPTEEQVEWVVLVFGAFRNLDLNELKEILLLEEVVSKD